MAIPTESNPKAFSQVSVLEKIKTDPFLFENNFLGELYDLDQDPGEFDNLWDDQDHSELKQQMIIKSFDASMQAIDLGPECIGPM